MSISRCLTTCLLILACIHAYADGVPGDCTQLIVGIAPTSNSMHGELRLFERARGEDWTAVAGPFPVLFGKNGIAWAQDWPDKTSLAFGRKNATVALLQAFSKLVRFLVMRRTCPPVATIH